MNPSFVHVEEILQHIESSVLVTSPLLDDYRGSYEALCNGTARPARKRRERKPSISAMIRRAEKAGKTVTAVTTADGVTLTFGQPSADDAKPNGNGTPEDLRKLI
jgi:hypothetical protein